MSRRRIKKSTAVALGCLLALAGKTVMATGVGGTVKGRVIAETGPAVAGGTFVSTSPSAGPITGLAGKCLDVQWGNTANGTQIQLWGCNGTSAQSWQRDRQTLKAMGKCLDVSGRATHDGAKIQLWDCNQTPAQDWVHQPDGALVNPHSGKCLDVEGAGTADGTKVQL